MRTPEEIKDALLRGSSGIAITFDGVKPKTQEYVVSGIDIDGNAVHERVSGGCSATSFKRVTRFRFA